MAKYEFTYGCVHATAILIFKLEENELRVIKCIMGNGNHTFKMADTDNFPEIIDDKSEKDTPLA